MKMVTNIDAEYKCGGEKAIEKFFKRYPEHAEVWKETFEYMLESGEEVFCDNVGNLGERLEWSYCLRLEIGENYTYLALMERA